MPAGKFVGECCFCKSEVWLPQALYDAALHGRGAITFYCPYGHPQVFAKGDSEATILRRERDRLKQQLAQKDDEIRARDARIDKGILAIAMLKKEGFKFKSRAKAGVCPCCNRTVRQMAAHMKSRHPDFKADEAA